MNDATFNRVNRGSARRAIAAIALLALVGCGGGGSPVTPAAAGTTAKVHAQVVIAFPAPTSPSSSARSPKYISPSTNGATISVYPAGNDVTPVFQQSDDLSSGSSLCSGSPRSCTIPMEVSPGNYDFVLSMYDAAPVSGVIPASAKELSTEKITATISPNGLNIITFKLQGIVVGAPTLTCSPTPCGALNYWALPADGTQHIFPIAVTATDADGNAITGSNPYTSPISVSLTESGGSGHTVLTVNGVSEGTSATLTSPADQLALVYDGGGAPGYTTTTNVAGTSLTMSPMYVVPNAAITEGLLTDTHTASVTEAGAPVSEAYTTSTTCGSQVSANASGSGASATLTMNSSVPGGTHTSCAVTVKDSLASAAMTIPFNFTVPGPITAGTPTFATGGSGTCGTGLNFTGTGQTAVMTLSDPGYSGTISSSSGATATATVSVSGTTATVTAGGTAGNTTVTFTDTAGNSLTCSNVSVTLTSGSAS
uniref:Uncharacterized protein n=1 Tax=mine drainage metagenome TaxID=410659 RepID=E6QPD0_9ZZZZ